MKILVAAAIPEGSIVGVLEDDVRVVVEIVKKENSTPISGLITWHLSDGETLVVNAGEEFEIISMPAWKDRK